MERPSGAASQTGVVRAVHPSEAERIRRGATLGVVFGLVLLALSRKRRSAGSAS